MITILKICYLLDCNGSLIETTLDAPKTKYEKIYSDKLSAIEDLVN